MSRTHNRKPRKSNRSNHQNIVMKHEKFEKECRAVPRTLAQEVADSMSSIRHWAKEPPIKSIVTGGVDHDGRVMVLTRKGGYESVKFY